MLTQPTTHPLQDGFVDAWETLKSKIADIRLCPECTSCPEQKSCMNCAAVTFAETGRFDGKPEYMCRLNRAYRNALKELANSFSSSAPTDPE